MLKQKRRIFIVTIVGLVVLLPVAGAVFLFEESIFPVRSALDVSTATMPTPNATVYAPEVAGVALAVPGDYMILTSEMAEKYIKPLEPVTIEVALSNPDPDYKLNLVVYIQNPPGLAFDRSDAAMPIAKILNPRHIPAVMLPKPAGAGEIIQGVLWHGEIGSTESRTFSVDYTLGPAPAETIVLRAIVYDGLSGAPVEEETLTFMTDLKAQLPEIPTPTPALVIPDASPPAPPVGTTVLRASLAATLQSASFQDHERAAQGLDRVEGSDIVKVPEEVYPYTIRSVSLTQCYFLNVYLVNRAVIEFDTREISPNFGAATLRIRSFIPNPPGHTISIHQGEWDWVFAGEETVSPLPGEDGVIQAEVVEIETTNQAVWRQYDPDPLAEWSVAPDYVEIKNITIPREAVNIGGPTRFMFISSAEALTPPAGSCYTGGAAGHGGAIALPELYIQ